MNSMEVLVLSGSPGAGKSTLANKLSELLVERDVPHAVIDVDELARIHPELDSSPKWANLAAIWSNYASVPTLDKVVLPVLIDSPDDLTALRAAVQGSTVHLVELTAGADTLLERVTAREPNEYWQTKLQALVQGYLKRPDELRFGDFSVDTEHQTPGESAEAILVRLDW